MLLALASIACAEEPKPEARPQYPKAEVIQTVHGSKKDLFEPPDGGKPCPTQVVTYGSDDIIDFIAKYYTDRGVELRERPPLEGGRLVGWNGVREGDEDTWMRVEAGSGTLFGYPAFRTVFKVITPECGSIANAAMSIKPKSVPFGKSPAIAIRNAGDIEVIYRPPYVVERKDGTQWVGVGAPPISGTPCPEEKGLTVLGPGFANPQKIVVCDKATDEPLDLPPGLYRITKLVFADSEGSSAPITLQKTFRVR